MNSTRPLLSDNPRKKLQSASVEGMIVDGLGYCCAFFFWSHYIDIKSPVLATRFGCTPETIRKHKQWFREDRFVCNCTEACLKERVGLP